MVNQEILEGLRTALARNYSLEEAMMSFWNSGYKKEAIEEAARALQQQTIAAQTPQAKSPAAQPPKPVANKIPQTIKPLPKPVGTKPVEAKPAESKKTKPTKAKLAVPKPAETKPADMRAIPVETSEKPEPTPAERKQLISKYGEKTKPKGRFMVILLFIILFLLTVGLIGVIIFRGELIKFLTSLLS